MGKIAQNRFSFTDPLNNYSRIRLRIRPRYVLELAEPPNLLIYDNANKVDEPHKRSTEEQKNGYNDSESVLNINAFYKTINSPNDVKHRDTKNKLNDKRKIVNSFD